MSEDKVILVSAEGEMGCGCPMEGFEHCCCPEDLETEPQENYNTH